MYYTYMIRCSDNSIYTGITNDINRRLNEHFNKTKKCAKYTKRHGAIKLEALFTSSTRSDAAILEYRIKKLKHHEKENIIKDNKLIFIYLKDYIIDDGRYKFKKTIDITLR